MKLLRLILVLFLLIQISFSRSEMGTSTLKNGGILMLNIWQGFLSPVHGSRCPYKPSCSAYARIAVNRYGAVKGSVLASERLHRCTACHNFHLYAVNKKGYYVDPVEGQPNE